jgi:DNA-binding GntR family transcriptional regulator
VERRDPEMARLAMRAHLEQVRRDSQAPSKYSSAKNVSPVSKITS